MFYKPEYCCHCGEKIEKTSFLPIRDSGRFCDVCRNDFPLQEIMPKVFIALCGLLGLFGLGSYFYGGDTANAVALKQSRISAPQNIVKSETAVNAPQNSNRQTTAQTAPKNDTAPTLAENKTVPGKGKVEAVKTVEEKTYFCGAMTKKGTPCSRKVKGGGRCWQHQGQEALYPQERLLIMQ